METPENTEVTEDNISPGEMAILNTMRRLDLSIYRLHERMSRWQGPHIDPPKTEPAGAPLFLTVDDWRTAERIRDGEIARLDRRIDDLKGMFAQLSRRVEEVAELVEQIRPRPILP